MMTTILKTMNKNKKMISDVLGDEDRQFWRDYVKDIKKIPNEKNPIIENKKTKFISIKRAEDFILKNRIDLHGYTLDQAYETVFDFIEINFNAGRKVIYIITGKGKPESDNTLNKLVPRWLNEKPLCNLVSSATFSSTNAGELCIKLKKQK